MLGHSGAGTGLFELIKDVVFSDKSSLSKYDNRKETLHKINCIRRATDSRKVDNALKQALGSCDRAL